jgi:putative ATPase
LPVPKKLRNAVTPLMREEGYGLGHRHAHDYEEHVVPGETYLPDELVGQRFYEPGDQGYEQQIRERLQRLRSNAR